MRRGRVSRNGYRRHIWSRSNHNQSHRNHGQKSISQRIFPHNCLRHNHKSDRILIPILDENPRKKPQIARNNFHALNNRDIVADRALMFSKPMFANGRSCPHCNTESLHRSHRRGIKDRFFNLLALRPVRCTCCCQRFYAPRAAHGPHIRPIAGPSRLN
jgi:hypothetical protein